MADFEIPLFDSRARQRPASNFAYKLAHMLGRKANKKTRRYRVRLTSNAVLHEMGCSARTVQRAYAELKRVQWVTDTAIEDGASAGKLGPMFGFTKTTAATTKTTTEDTAKRASGHGMRRLTSDL